MNLCQVVILEHHGHCCSIVEHRQHGSRAFSAAGCYCAEGRCGARMEECGSLGTHHTHQPTKTHQHNHSTSAHTSTGPNHRPTAHTHSTMPPPTCFEHVCAKQCSLPAWRSCEHVSWQELAVGFVSPTTKNLKKSSQRRSLAIYTYGRMDFAKIDGTFVISTPLLLENDFDQNRSSKN